MFKPEDIVYYRGQICKICAIIDHVAMILPFNTGHEQIVRLANLRVQRDNDEEETLSIGTKYKT